MKKIIPLLLVVILLSGCTSREGSFLGGSLLYVAEQGWEDVATVLIRMGADINTRDQEGRTPLILAAGFGNNEVVKLLIKKGAYVNAKNDEKRTALNYARELYHESTVKLLLNAGAT